ncbi:MAG: response regulator [Proteobacteria bacterium]|nr:response regulator [Pseudomonadota bacterium]MBU1737527.1 response regulator [Pseudomonadota bacterium]
MTTKTLLIVDDEKSILTALKRALADGDFRILTAGSGQAALDLIQSQEIHVILTDNRMPEMSGIELLTKIRTTSPGTVRIMMTGYADLSTAMEAINSGEIFKFIVKPWDNAELLQIICQAMTRFPNQKD